MPSSTNSSNSRIEVRYIQTKSSNARIKIRYPYVALIQNFEATGTISGLIESQTVTPDKHVEGSNCIRVDRTSTSSTATSYYRWEKSVSGFPQIHNIVNPISLTTPTPRGGHILVYGLQKFTDYTTSVYTEFYKSSVYYEVNAIYPSIPHLNKPLEKRQLAMTSGSWHSGTPASFDWSALDNFAIRGVLTGSTNTDKSGSGYYDYAIMFGPQPALNTASAYIAIRNSSTKTATARITIRPTPTNTATSRIKIKYPYVYVVQDFESTGTIQGILESQSLDTTRKVNGTYCIKGERTSTSSSILAYWGWYKSLGSMSLANAVLPTTDSQQQPTAGYLWIYKLSNFKDTNSYGYVELTSGSGTFCGITLHGGVAPQNLNQPLVKYSVSIPSSITWFGQTTPYDWSNIIGFRVRTGIGTTLSDRSGACFIDYCVVFGPQPALNTATGRVKILDYSTTNTSNARIAIRPKPTNTGNARIKRRWATNLKILFDGSNTIGSTTDWWDVGYGGGYNQATYGTMYKNECESQSLGYDVYYPAQIGDRPYSTRFYNTNIVGGWSNWAMMKDTPVLSAPVDMLSIVALDTATKLNDPKGGYITYFRNDYWCCGYVQHRLRLATTAGSDYTYTRWIMTINGDNDDVCDMCDTYPRRTPVKVTYPINGVYCSRSSTQNTLDWSNINIIEFEEKPSLTSSQAPGDTYFDYVIAYGPKNNVNTANAHILIGGYQSTKNSNARTKIEYSFTKTATARILINDDREYNYGTATVQKSVAKTRFSNSRLIVGFFDYNISRARVAIQPKPTNTSNARIINGTQVYNQSNSRIETSFSVTKTSNSRITIGGYQSTNSGNGKIAIRSTYTNTSNARILKEYVKTNTSTARLKIRWACKMHIVEPYDDSTVQYTTGFWDGVTTYDQRKVYGPYSFRAYTSKVTPPTTATWQKTWPSPIDLMNTVYPRDGSGYSSVIGLPTQGYLMYWSRKNIGTSTSLAIDFRSSSTGAAIQLNPSDGDGNGSIRLVKSIKAMNNNILVQGGLLTWAAMAMFRMKWYIGSSVPLNGDAVVDYAVVYGPKNNLNTSQASIKIEGLQQTNTSNSRITLEWFQNNQGRARIYVPDIKKTQSSRARLITPDVANNNYANSRIEIEYQQTASSVARVKIKYPKTNTSNSRIELEADYAITSTARISVPDRYTNTSNSRILVAGTFQNNSARAMISVPLRVTQQCRARIATQHANLTNTANARLYLERRAYNYSNARLYAPASTVGGASPFVEAGSDAPVVCYLTGPTAMTIGLRTLKYLLNGNARVTY
jgi:hypothetical protein